MERCRDCKLFDIEAATDGDGWVQIKLDVQCRWVSTESYPVSVTCRTEKRPIPSRMRAYDGEMCPCFQKRDAK